MHSIPRWISSVLKQFGVGFSRRGAERLSSHISSIRSSKGSSNPNFSPYVQEFLGRLSSLSKKGVKVASEDLFPLLRKGQDHLNQATKAYEKIEKTKPIRNPNGFLSWLVSLKNPLNLFKPKQLTKAELVEWTKTKLTQIKDCCEFLGPQDIPTKTDADKAYVYFAVHKEDPTRSFLRVTWFSRGLYSLWQDATLSVSDPGFRQKFSEIFFKKEGALHGNAKKRSTVSGKLQRKEKNA